jgi:hypothetical protein
MAEENPPRRNGRKRGSLSQLRRFSPGASFKLSSIQKLEGLFAFSGATAASKFGTIEVTSRCRRQVVLGERR